MPFGCVPIRQSWHSSPSTSAKSSLQCLSAVCLSGGRWQADRLPQSLRRLQCLSAVCLSGSYPYDYAWRAHDIASPMPFGCVPIRQRANAAPLRCARLVSNAFRLCAYPAGEGRREGGHAGGLVSNAFRLCAYPAERPKKRPRPSWTRLQCLSAVCLSGSRKFNSKHVSVAYTCLQCLSAVCLSGRRLRHQWDRGVLVQSPMPFGCVPIRQARITARSSFAHAYGLQCLSAVCLSGRIERCDECGWTGEVSPMPFGCVPIRQMMAGASQAIRAAIVSNAFRLCAYPAGWARNLGSCGRTSRLQCLSAVCLSGRPTRRMSLPPFTAGLQCLSAVCLSGSCQSSIDPSATIPGSPMPFGCVPIRQRSGWRWRPSSAAASLQCLSAVCLSGRLLRSANLHALPLTSPMPFGCVPIRQRLCSPAFRAGFFCLQCLSAVCLSGRGFALRHSVLVSSVSNAFRLCAYPAVMTTNGRVTVTPSVSNAFRLCAYPAVHGTPRKG